MENRRPFTPRKGFSQRRGPLRNDGNPTYRGDGAAGPSQIKGGRRESARPRSDFDPSAGSFDPRSNPNPRTKFPHVKRPTAKSRSGGSVWDKRSQIKITSELQITDGKYRGKFLENVVSPRSLPTRRRLRELFFKILSRRIRAGRFLDLCSGCGMIGLEAISRGAMLSTFVERSARMCTRIRKNMEFCGIKAGHGEVIESETIPFLKRMGKKRRFWDVIYFSTPSETETAAAFVYFGKGVSIDRNGTLIVEHDSTLTMPEMVGLLRRGRMITQDEKSLSFYQRS